MLHHRADRSDRRQTILHQQYPNDLALYYDDHDGQRPTTIHKLFSNDLGGRDPAKSKKRHQTIFDHDGRRLHQQQQRDGLRRCRTTPTPVETKSSSLSFIGT